MYVNSETLLRELEGLMWDLGVTIQPPFFLQASMGQHWTELERASLECLVALSALMYILQLQ